MRMIGYAALFGLSFPLYFYLIHSYDRLWKPPNSAMEFEYPLHIFADLWKLSMCGHSNSRRLQSFSLALIGGGVM